MKILKTILIVIFALLFALSGGLLVYSAINPPTELEKEKIVIGGAPALSLYEGGKATYDVKAIREDEDLAPEKKATDIMVQAAYNLINIKQFFFNARVDVEAASSWAFSDYHYTKNGLDNFKRAQAYTGSLNTFVLRSYYGDQRFEKSGMSDYDFDKESWSYTATLKSGVEETKNRSKDEETPYFYYGTLDFPLDFGGVKAKWIKEGRSEAIDYTMIDAASVKIEDSEEGYFTLSFNCNVAALNASEETKLRLSGTTTDGRMENIVFTDFTVTAEVWKDSGVFRTLHYVTNVHASLSGKSGNSLIEKTMKFSYDDENCSIAKKITTEQYFYDNLNAANKKACDDEVAALAAAAAEKADKAAKQDKDDEE